MKINKKRPGLAYFLKKLLVTSYDKMTIRYFKWCGVKNISKWKYIVIEKLS